ncbi:hypothetical protein C5167_028243 [Papaver somniferum]|nr:hypothetical protein C5167_028243 [Papaver somniferum]
MLDEMMLCVGVDCARWELLVIRREISTMKLIKHPYIVQVMGSKAKSFIVLEFVTGGELFEKVVTKKEHGLSQIQATANKKGSHDLVLAYCQWCDEVAEALIAQGLHVVSLHAGRSQSERREAGLRNFRNSLANILVAIDVASRGLDVTRVAHVINLDLTKIYFSSSLTDASIVNHLNCRDSGGHVKCLR